MGFKEKLAHLIETREGGNQSAFARKAELDAASVRQYLAGSQPTLGKAIKIAHAYDVSLDWLVDEEFSSPPAVPAPGAGDFVPLPLLDVRASAGGGRLAIIDDTEAQVVAFKYDWLRRLGVNPKHAAIIMAEGDSMEPTISHGDLILVDKSIDRIIDEGIYVLVLAGLVLLKRIQVSPTGVILLKSDNPAYQPFEIKPHEQPDLVIEGRVRWSGGAI